MPIDALTPCKEMEEALLAELVVPDDQPDEFPEIFSHAYHKYANALIGLTIPQVFPRPASPWLGDTWVGIDSMWPLIKYFRDNKLKKQEDIKPSDMGKAFCAYWQTVGLKPVPPATLITNNAAALEGAFVHAVYAAMTDVKEDPPFYSLILSVQEVAVRWIQWTVVYATPDGPKVKLENISTTYAMGTNPDGVDYLPEVSAPGMVYPEDLHLGHD